MGPRGGTEEPGRPAGTKRVEGKESRKKLRDRPGAFPLEALPPVEQQEVVNTRELEPSEDFARRGDIETERHDDEGSFPGRGRGDEESGRPVQLDGKRHQKQEPTTETPRK